MPRGKANPEDAALFNALKMALATLKAGTKRIDTETLKHDISASQTAGSVHIDIKPKGEATDELPE